ncbi:MAG TPA: signal peptide peptidase SppA [Steroidobacteraceae bacterium]|nr:signal peptide peptidase SppA [Steroidobacteraceae bacterium]
MRAIRRLLHWIWVGLDGLRKILHLLLLLLIFALIGALFSRPIPLVPAQAALVVAPQGPLVEQFTGDPVERAIADAVRQGPVETRLRDVVDAITAAKNDKRISALYLDLGGLDGGGTAKLQEVARAIEHFRKSGKPVIAFGEYYDQPQYYVAAHADEIYLDPQGIAYIDGFANYGLFVKDALDKLSIDWNVFRVGQYKSAVEMFTRNDMSPAEREESLVWLDSIWSTWKAEVAKARGIEPAALQAYADNAPAALRAAGGDLARVALDAGLVTELKGRYEVEDRLAEITGEDEDLHSYKGIDYESYLANVQSTKALSSKSANKIAVIVASGEIVPGEQAPGTIGSDTLAAQLREARFDDDVKAVVLRIDSPGGSTFASEVIRREIEELRADGKAVVASMSTLAASGGYYIAMDADRIVASPATLTGSIGIFAMFPTFQRSLERLGVHVDGVGTTALSGEFSPVRPMSEGTRELLQQSIDHEYQRFIGLVAKSRKKDVAAVDAVAQGRVWSGADAKRLGLVDQLGGYEDAIKLAARLAELGKDYEVEYSDYAVGIGEALGLRVQAAMARIVAPLLPQGLFSALPRALRPLATEIERLNRLRDPRNVYMYCLGCQAGQ